MNSTLTAMPTDKPRDILKRAGNPFRNYFARNPDDDVCARYHVPELFATERDLLHAIIDLYRTDASMHSEVVPILGNKGAGKTHLLHSIKHAIGGQWQLLITPGVYQRETDFLEYLLFQIIDTMLGGGKQKGARPLEFISDQLVRRQLGIALRELNADEIMELFPAPGIGRWARRLGLGGSQAKERAEWLADNLTGFGNSTQVPTPLLQALSEAGLTPQRAYDLLAAHTQKSESRDTGGLMRRQILQGFAKAALLRDEAELANFLTYGFAELDFQIRPTRQDLVLAMFKVLMELLRSLKTPVVVAFDQLEDLLLARRSDDAHKIAETFFAGIVQAMHQVDGLCFLVFAERGLWNRFVPSLDGYIQDRLNNPVHVPQTGTVQALRLEAPTPELVHDVVVARLRPVLDELPRSEQYGELHPFTSDQVERVARTESTLRDMLQQFRHLFDHLIYGAEEKGTMRSMEEPTVPFNNRVAELDHSPFTPKGQPFTDTTAQDKQNRINSLLGRDDEISTGEVTIKSVAVVETDPEPESTGSPSQLDPNTLAELWDQEFRAARRKLEPDGALTGATRELQAALGTFLDTCLEHGVKVGPWRLQHVVSEWTFGDHPTYGVVSLAHWACKDGQPWKVGIGLFLARGAGKPKDLDIKLGVMDIEPQVVDHLILMRQEDDMAITGKSKTLWAAAEKQGKHSRLEAIALDGFAQLYSFPRWLAAVRESLPEEHRCPTSRTLFKKNRKRSWNRLHADSDVSISSFKFQVSN